MSSLSSDRETRTAGFKRLSETQARAAALPLFRYSLSRGEQFEGALAAKEVEKIDELLHEMIMGVAEQPGPARPLNPDNPSSHPQPSDGDLFQLVLKGLAS